MRIYALFLFILCFPISILLADEPPQTDVWELIFQSAAGDSCNDTELIGCEFAEGRFYLTGGNNGNDPNKVYILNQDGSYLDEFDQWNSSGEGWKGLAFDWMYLYGCQNDVIYAFDPQGNPITSMNIHLSLPSCDALTYDPVTEHFWLASSGTLYEVNRYGTICDSMYVGSVNMVGLAWNYYTGMLWIFGQDSTSTAKFCQIDPVTHEFTGYTYSLPLLPGTTSQSAGDIFFTDGWQFPYEFVFGGITQSSPSDQLFVLNQSCQPPPDPTVTITYISGSPVPVSGGELCFDLTVENNQPVPSIMDVWLDVEFEGGDPFTATSHHFSEFPPLMQLQREDICLPIPENWESGNYELFLRAGIEPNIVFDEDSFPFEKSGVAVEDPTHWDDHNTPTSFHLHPCYPNPFNPTTVISFQLQVASQVKLEVFDVNGRNVGARRASPSGRRKTDPYATGFYSAGSHTVTFDATGLPSGIYIYRIEAGEFMATGKMVLMK